MTARVIVLDPCFDAATADAMVDLCERFGRYRMYAEHEQLDTDIGRGLSQRHDSAHELPRTGGPRGRRAGRRAGRCAPATSARSTRTGATSASTGIAPFLYHEAFVDAARSIHGRPVIEPAIAYANLMVPGQELAVHTDVPEFRGANRKVVPQWLLVVMHHSGLFDEYRMPIATAVAWFHDCDGGELAYWPDGATAAPRRHAARFNTALVLDTDTVFHGVDRIADVAAEDLPPIRPGTTLGFAGLKQWSLRDADGIALADVRLGTAAVLGVVEGVLLPRRARARHLARAPRRPHARRHPRPPRRRSLSARAATRRCRDGALGELLIDEYVTFPMSTTSSTS